MTFTTETFDALTQAILKSLASTSKSERQRGVPSHY